MSAPTITRAAVTRDRRAAGRLALVIGALYGLAGSGVSAVSVALPELAADLGGGTSRAAWVISGYVVTLAVATAVYGRVADLVGIRVPLVCGVSLMAVGAALAALAPNLPLLIAARLAQGAGAAAIPVLGTALVVARWDGPVRAAALGRVAAGAAVLGSLGPLIGGGLDAAGGWRWTLAPAVLAVAALPVLWREAPAIGTGGRFDVPGALAVVAAAAGLVLLIQAPATGAEAAIAGAVLLALGAPAVPARVRARPAGFLPRVVVTDRQVLRLAFAAGAAPVGWFALLVAVPAALAARGWSPLDVGIGMVPAALAALVMARGAGVLITRFGAERALTLGAALAGAALLTATAGAAAGAPALLLTGFAAVVVAFGIGQPAMVAAIGSAVAPALRGVALGVAGLIYLVSGGLGSAVVGGLGESLGLPGALAVLVVLPALAVTLMVGADVAKAHA